MIFLCILVFGIFLFLSTYPLFAYPYVITSYAPLMILVVYFLASRISAFKSLLGGVGGAILLNWIIFGGLTAYHYQGEPLLHFFQHPLSQYPCTVVPASINLKATQEYCDKVQPVIGFFQAKSKRADDMYLLADDSLEIYPLINHINPTPYSYHAFSIDSDGQDIIQHLEAHQVQFVVMNGAQESVIPFQPLLVDYLHRHFKLAFQSRHFLILERYL